LISSWFQRKTSRRDGPVVISASQLLSVLVLERLPAELAV
jgi:hypothetical protein